jgi:hypothetical protein
VLFDTLDFNRSANAARRPAVGILVVYRRCGSCGFVFTRTFDDFVREDWTVHVYNDGYAKVDPEFAQARPLRNARAVQSYFAARRRSAVGLDFGLHEGPPRRSVAEDLP